MITTTIYISYQKKDFNGENILKLRVLSVDKQGNHLATEQQKASVIVVPVNDSPYVLNSSQLHDVLEGEYGEWNLKNRFMDIDSDLTKLKINVQHKYSKSEYRQIPSWLSINDFGILSGTPSNDDVGEYTFLVTAEDDFGDKSSFETRLSVGNINNKPIFENKDIENWTISNSNGVYQMGTSVLLRDKIELDLDQINFQMRILFMEIFSHIKLVQI